MDDYISICQITKANITYLAIGSAFSFEGGPQQHPPFLEKIISQYQEFTFEIIIIDPLTENPPKITEYYNLESIEPNYYKRNNLIVNVIREKFSFDFWNSDSKNAQKSKNLLYSLIDRTINSKSENPNETCLLFVHDFTGYYIDKFSDMIWEDYQKKNKITEYFYKKNVLIDINNKIDAGCFVDLNSMYFHPELIVDSHGAIEILNPFLLDDFDIYTLIITSKKYNSSNIEKLLIHVITHRLEDFCNNILPNYRQFRINNVMNDNLFRIKTSEMLSKLISITKYLDFFSNSLREEIFGDFINLCKNPIMLNPYDIIKKFIFCQKKLELFLLNLNPNDYYVILNDLAINYVIKNNKFPLFMELLLQK